MKLLLHIFIFTFSFYFSNAQDKIIFKKGDTLLVKITSLENQKAIYSLVNGGQNTIQSSQITELHKIIWRNGKELIFDKELEQTLIKNQENYKIQKELLTALPQKKSSPKLAYKGMIFVKFYENGEKVSKYRVREILQYYDKKSLPKFNEGLLLDTNAKKVSGGILGIASAIFSLGETLRSISDLNQVNAKSTSKGTIVFVGFIISGVTFTIMKSKSSSVLKDAIDDYNKNN